VLLGLVVTDTGWPGTSMLVFLILGLSTTAHCLSCPPCGGWPCETPACCPSGEYITGICGCCHECAQPQDQPCGGPWGGEGTCASPLRCLRSCHCLAETGDPCVFPFKWRKNNQTYTSCTKDGSENGQSWCATKVNKKGFGVRGHLKDCQPGCPGSEYECSKDDLFNYSGKCVTSASAKRIKARSILPVQLDEFHGKTAGSFLLAPLCPSGRTTEISQKKCKCGPELPMVGGGAEGGCSSPGESETGRADYFDGEEPGWCFLDNVQDPTKPGKDCYSDTGWSVSRGRFWSREACQEEAGAPQKG